MISFGTFSVLSTCLLQGRATETWDENDKARAKDNVAVEQADHHFRLPGRDKPGRAAAQIAAALQAEKLILMTDVPGVLRDKNDVSTKFTELSIRQTRNLVAEGVIAGGMIPKCALLVMQSFPHAAAPHDTHAAGVPWAFLC